MPKTKTKNLTDTANSGCGRIEEIKSVIASFKQQTCKAEVYETWDNIFNPEDQ